jgi:hypothetical protein
MLHLKSFFKLPGIMALCIPFAIPTTAQALLDPDPDLWIKISEEGTVPTREVYYIRANTIQSLYTPEQIEQMKADPYSNTPAFAADLAATATRTTRVIRIREQGQNPPELMEMRMAIACPSGQLAINRTDTYATLDPASEVTVNTNQVLSIDTAPWTKQAYLAACQEDVWRSAFLSYADPACAAFVENNPNYACLYTVQCSDERLAPLGMGCVPEYYSKRGWYLRKYTDILLWNNEFRRSSYPVH